MFDSAQAITTDFNRIWYFWRWNREFYWFNHNVLSWLLMGHSILLFFMYYFGSKDNVQSVGSHPVQSGSFDDAFYEYRTWVLFACYAVCCGVEIVFYIVAAQYFQ
eukprot:1015886_1